jgi:hypothetical protein
VATLHTPQIGVPCRLFADDWCVGPYRKQWSGTDVFGHSGTTPNGSSTLLWVPELGATLATVVNTPARGYHFADRVLGVLADEWLKLRKPDRPAPDWDPIPAAERYVGHYRSIGLDYDVSESDGRLLLRLDRGRDNDPGADDRASEVRTRLLPIDAHRFLPEDDDVTSDHQWDIAFTLGADGRAMLLHNGAFAARRVR